jgi:hypothetical protein
MGASTGSRRLAGATIAACGAALALAPAALATGLSLPPLPGGVSVPPLPLSLLGGLTTAPGGVQTPLPGGTQVPCVLATPLTPETCPAVSLNPGGSTGGAGGGSTGTSGGAGASQPKVSLRIPRQRMAAVLARGLKVTVRSDAAGALAVTVVLPAGTTRKLHLGRRALVLGRTSARLAKPGAKTIRVRIAKQARKGLSRTRAVKLTVSATATDSAGNPGKPAVRRANVRR